MTASFTRRSAGGNPVTHGSTTATSANRPPIHIALAAVCAQSTVTDNQTGGVAPGCPFSDVATIRAAARPTVVMRVRRAGVPRRARTAASATAMSVRAAQIRPHLVTSRCCRLS